MNRKLVSIYSILLCVHGQQGLYEQYCHQSRDQQDISYHQHPQSRNPVLFHAQVHLIPQVKIAIYIPLLLNINHEFFY